MLFFMSGAIQMLMFLIVIAVLITIIVSYFMITKNQERIRLIEKGINPDEGQSIAEYQKRTSLKNGVLFIAFALGLFAGYMLETYCPKMDDFVAYVSMILLFGGIGFLINFFIMRNWNSKNDAR